MGENEQGGMLRTVVVVGLVAIIAAAVIFAVTGLKNATSNTREDTVNKVENLSFYGRNLLLGSKNFSTNSGTNPWAAWGETDSPFVTNETYNGAKITATSRQWGGYKYNLGALKNQGVLNEKDTYIMSAWFKNTSDTPVWIGFYNGNDVHFTDSSHNWVVKLEPHGEWTRAITEPFKFKNLNDESINNAYIRFEPICDVVNGRVYQTSVKLEKGDQATDYTTAPEDN